jgi:diaminopimelate decarboxylase
LAASGNFGTVVRRNYPLPSPPNSAANRSRRPALWVASAPLDRLADKAGFPHADVGDLVAVFCAGAYGASASPSAFLGQGPAREMLL